MAPLEGPARCCPGDVSMRSGASSGLLKLSSLSADGLLGSPPASIKESFADKTTFYKEGGFRSI
jgi:hypothetical protein